MMQKIFLIMTLALVGCGSRIIQKRCIPQRKLALTDTARYATLKTNLFDPYCIGCHNSIASSGGVNLSTQSSVEINLDSVIGKLSGQTPKMPPLGSRQIPTSGSEPTVSSILADLNAYKASLTATSGGNGASGSSGGSGLESEVTYAKLNTELFLTQCRSCHAADTKASSGGIDLSTEALFNEKISAIISRLNSSVSPMPPGVTTFANKDAILLDLVAYKNKLDSAHLETVSGSSGSFSSKNSTSGSSVDPCAE